MFFYLFEERDSQCNLWCHVKIVTQLGPHPQAYTSDWDPYQTGCHYVCIGLPVFVPQHKFLGTLLSHSVIIILFMIIIMISWHSYIVFSKLHEISGGVNVCKNRIARL